MDKIKRFDIFFERHIGIGIRWDTFEFPFQLSIAFPFITVTIGFGRWKHERLCEEFNNGNEE